MSRIRLFLLLLLLAFPLSKGFSQSAILSDSAKISILTIGTANESHTLYGHTGLRVLDEQRGLDVVYNFGYFDFNTPYFLAKFVKGDLQYFVATNQYADFEYGYREENRSIYEQELNLSKIQKQKLLDELNKNLYSDERFYTYKFIDKNCTTMVIDKVNDVLGGKIITTKKPVTVTYREILNPYLSGNFFQKLGINIIFGPKTDKKAEVLFLPLELMNVLKTTAYNGKPLVTETKTIFEAKPIKTVSYWNNIYVFSALILLIIVLKNNTVYITYFTILGLLGVFLSLVGFYSFHEEVRWNYNVLLFNPSLLLLLYFYKKKNRKWISNLALFNLACIAIYLIVIINKAQLLLFMPLLITSTIILAKWARKNKKIKTATA
ncbi:membrane protein implicated in regulation of membrane protease activity [Flavobacterium sp. 28YEA47A]|uniref:lipoprotein N-acyltransferase Lnb domain-containing protein n=1 Tax=Flavobacterium sp. 28YEA47A TaxID=3156276 RepID=UPI003514913B